MFVFIHAGIFSIGSNWWPQFDAAELVGQFEAIGRSMIRINIKYDCRTIDVELSAYIFVKSAI